MDSAAPLLLLRMVPSTSSKSPFCLWAGLIRRTNGIVSTAENAFFNGRWLETAHPPSQVSWRDHATVGTAASLHFIRVQEPAITLNHALDDVDLGLGRRDLQMHATDRQTMGMGGRDDWCP